MSYNALKDAIQLAKKLNQMELYEQLLEVKEKLSDLREDNLAKGEQIKELLAQLELNASIEFDKGIYWIRQDPVAGGEKDTPICPKCFGADNLVMRLSVDNFEKGPAVHCSHCKQTHWIR